MGAAQTDRPGCLGGSFGRHGREGGRGRQGIPAHPKHRRGCRPGCHLDERCHPGLRPPLLLLLLFILQDTIRTGH